jgi:hypothetical protein
MSGFNLQLDAEAFRPLVRAIAQEVLAALEEDRGIVNGKVAYPEPEAAALLSLAPHQLGDERRRGRIAASVGPRGMILYSREDLLGYLRCRRWKKGKHDAKE